jgi:hypothetical protein
MHAPFSRTGMPRSELRDSRRSPRQPSIAELYADKGLQLESVDKAHEARMRTILITDFWRGLVLTPDNGRDVFLLIRNVTHDEAYGRAGTQFIATQRRLHTPTLSSDESRGTSLPSLLRRGNV